MCHYTYREKCGAVERLCTINSSALDNQSCLPPNGCASSLFLQSHEIFLIELDPLIANLNVNKSLLSSSCLESFQ